MYYIFFSISLMLQCLMHFGYAGSSSHEPDRFPRCCQRGTENSDFWNISTFHLGNGISHQEALRQQQRSAEFRRQMREMLGVFRCSI